MVKDHPKDRLLIQQLAVNTIIGIYPHERETSQCVFLDLEIAIDAKGSALTDSITSAIDYAAICHYLREYIPTTSFNLLETFAIHIGDKVLEKFSLSWLRLTVTKKPYDLPEIGGIKVTVERGKE